jgi:hypothetical protein
MNGSCSGLLYEVPIRLLMVRAPSATTGLTATELQVYLEMQASKRSKDESIRVLWTLLRFPRVC